MLHYIYNRFFHYILTTNTVLWHQQWLLVTNNWENKNKDKVNIPDMAITTIYCFIITKKSEEKRRTVLLTYAN